MLSLKYIKRDIIIGVNNELCNWWRGAYYQPPEDGFECTWCAGHGRVFVHSIYTALDEIVEIIPDIDVDCPHCDGTGEVPELDEYDDPSIL